MPHQKGWINLRPWCELTFSGAGGAGEGRVYHWATCVREDIGMMNSTTPPQQGLLLISLLLYLVQNPEPPMLTLSVLCRSKVSPAHRETSPLMFQFWRCKPHHWKVHSVWVISNQHASLSHHPKKHQALNQLPSHIYGFKDKQMEGQGLWKEGFTFSHSRSPASILRLPFAPALQPLNPTSALKKKEKEKEEKK